MPTGVRWALGFAGSTSPYAGVRLLLVSLPGGAQVNRAVTVLIVIGTCSVGLATAHADTGTYHRCLLDGGGTAEVYTSGNGRDVTLDVQGARV